MECRVRRLRRNTFICYVVTGSIPINRGLIQAILTSLPPQPIGEATKASNLQRTPPGVYGRSHFTYFLYLIVQIRILKITPTHDPIREFAHYFDPNQPGAKSDYDSEDREEEVEYMTNDEVVMSEQEESNHRITKNIKHFEEKDDVDEWLNAEITKHMSMQGVENMKDVLISIIKSIRQEMKDGIMKRQFEASTASVSYEVSSITSNEVDRVDDNTPITAPCRLPKELSPRSFLLPFNINNHNLCATSTLDAKDNIMPQRVY
ncbi:hypothetical protein Tco_0478786 [Tanacetum coccineum]